MRYKNIFDAIGNTPVVELTHYAPHSKIKIFAKLEGTNPGGSVKDRVACWMMKDAYNKGLLDKNKTIIEATSGNTGIGIAMIAAAFGYKFTAVMPESASVERRKILKMYGAEIILTDGRKGTNYAIQVAHSIVKSEPEKYIMLDQFANPAHVMAHYEKTGPEIINDVPEVTHFVSAMGTGGTLMGIGRFLKKQDRYIRIVGVEPRPGSTVQGLRNMDAYVPPIYKKEELDQVLFLADDAIAFNLARDIYKREGISVGISSGAALWGALHVAKTIERGTIVTLFPDRGDRYTSTSLFGNEYTQINKYEHRYMQV